jgi:hypothetical protein
MITCRATWLEKTGRQSRLSRMKSGSQADSLPHMAHSNRGGRAS